MTERSGVTHPPELSEAIGDALFRLARALERDMAAAAEPEGLTPLLARILRNIGDAESQRQLGHALGVGPAQISVATSELVRRKLVERKADPDDHRLRRPQLTAKGRAAVARIEARSAASSPVAQALDEKQMRTLLRSLERIDALNR